MRVLILANNDVGLFKFRKELIETLLLDGHKVFIALPKGDFILQLKKMGCIFINTNIDRRGVNPVKDMHLFLRYIRLVNHLKPNIVFTYTIKPNIYGGLACSLSKIPYVANITGLGTAVEKRGFLQLVTTLMYKVSLKNVQTVFFQNKENEGYFEKNAIAVDKHKMLPGSGVNLDYYKLLPYPDENTIEFVFISRIMKEKGIDQYLEMAEYIRKKYPQTRFHICGFCEEEYEDILKAYEDKGIITYHGLIMDVREVLAYTHCTIHPSYYPEGISNVLLESAASGRPLISTDRSGCREVIDDGVNGYIVPQKDAKALIEAVEKFLKLSNEERRMMGLYGREKVKMEFDRKIVVNAYMKEVSHE